MGLEAEVLCDCLPYGSGRLVDLAFSQKDFRTWQILESAEESSLSNESELETESLPLAELS